MYKRGGIGTYLNNCLFKIQEKTRDVKTVDAHPWEFFGSRIEVCLDEEKLPACLLPCTVLDRVIKIRTSIFCFLALK